MDISQDIFVRLLIAAFGLTFGGFLIRGVSRIVVEPETAETLSTPVFLLAMLCAIAGFVLALIIKIQSVLGDSVTA